MLLPTQTDYPYPGFDSFSPFIVIAPLSVIVITLISRIWGHYMGIAEVD